MIRALELCAAAARYGTSLPPRYFQPSLPPLPPPRPKISLAPGESIKSKAPPLVYICRSFIPALTRVSSRVTIPSRKGSSCRTNATHSPRTRDALEMQLSSVASRCNFTLSRRALFSNPRSMVLRNRNRTRDTKIRREQTIIT